MNLDELEQMWLATSKMGVELKKKGVDLSRAFQLLRDAKPLLSECRLDEDADPEFLKLAEDMLNEAQMEILSTGDALGEKFLEKWSDILDKVRRGEKIGEFPLSKPSFYPGMPRGKWVKLAPLKGLGAKKLKGIAKKHGIELQSRDGDYILTGDEEGLKNALGDIRDVLKVKR